MTDILLLRLLFALASATFLLALYMAKLMIALNLVAQKHNQTLYGVDGKNGLVSRVKGLEESAQHREHRVQRLEHFLDVPPPPVPIERKQ